MSTEMDVVVTRLGCFLLRCLLLREGCCHTLVHLRLLLRVSTCLRGLEILVAEFLLALIHRDVK